MEMLIHLQRRFIVLVESWSELYPSMHYTGYNYTVWLKGFVLRRNSYTCDKIMYHFTSLSKISADGWSRNISPSSCAAVDGKRSLTPFAEFRCYHSWCQKLCPISDRRNPLSCHHSGRVISQLTFQRRDSLQHEDFTTYRLFPLCKAIHRLAMDYPQKWILMRTFDVYFAVSIKKSLNKHSSFRWCELWNWFP